MLFISQTEEAKVKISEMSGERVDNKTKLDIIKQEEQAIRAEEEAQKATEQLEKEKKAKKLEEEAEAKVSEHT